MATIVLSSVADVWPVGTTVSIYPASAVRDADAHAPVGTAITSAAVASNGSLTLTNAGIVNDGRYVCAAQVNGVWRVRRCSGPASASTLAATDPTVTPGARRDARRTISSTV